MTPLEYLKKYQDLHVPVVQNGKVVRELSAKVGKYVLLRASRAT